MAALALVGLAKTFPNGAVGLRPTDLAVAAGERLALLGPSGGGKTTLLRLVAGLEDPTAGDVFLHGERVTPVPPHRRGVGMVFQRPALYPQWTVRRQIETRDDGRVRDAIDLLRLSPLLDRHPHELSGGEQQRVALARLVVRRPAVWLLDEPLAALDPAFRSEFRADLLLLLADLRPTMLLVTHDPTDATALGHRVGVLANGSLRHVGPADGPDGRPGNRFVAVARGRFNIIDGDVADGRFVGGNGALVVPAPANTPATRLTLGAGPDDFVRRAPGSGPPKEPGVVLEGWPVVLVEPDGGGWLLTLARHGCRVRVATPPGPPPTDSADWFLPADRCLWFDPVTGDRTGDGGGERPA